MKEYKFRAWDMYHKKMIHLGTLEDIYLAQKAGKDYDFANYKVMESTGREDVNGKEIYKGDIVKYRVSMIKGAESGAMFQDVYTKTFICDYYGVITVINSAPLSLSRVIAVEFPESQRDYYTIERLKKISVTEERVEILGDIHRNPNMLVDIASKFNRIRRYNS